MAGLINYDQTEYVGIIVLKKSVMNACYDINYVIAYIPLKIKDLLLFHYIFHTNNIQQIIIKFYK